MNTAFATEAREATLKMTPHQKLLMEKRGKKIYLGHEQRKGWSGKLPFYLFWCEDCKQYAKDYPHGHIERRYLLCAHCGVYHNFVPWWVEFALFWQMIRNFFIPPSMRK